MSYRPDASQCWLCGERRLAEQVPYYPRKVKSRAATLQFQLDTAILTVVLISVLLAVTRVAPGPSLLALVVAAAAYVRTGRLLARRESSPPASAREKVASFLKSVLVVLVMLSGATLVFLGVLIGCVACGFQLTAWLGTSFVESGCGVGVALSSFLALATLFGIGYRLRF